MKQKVGIFGVGCIFVCAGFGLLTNLDPQTIVMIIWIVAASCLTGLFFVARSMHREGRVLRAYDLELQQICANCGYDLRATPGRCPECGRKCNRRDVEFAETDAEKP